MDEEKRKLIEGVRSLRRAHLATQQEFAVKLGRAIRTIARWETCRPPSGYALVELCWLALEIYNVDLARVFFDALMVDLRELSERIDEIASYGASSSPDQDVAEVVNG